MTCYNADHRSDPMHRIYNYDGTVAPATVDLAAAFRASAEMLPASVYPAERAALLQAAEDFARKC